ncbi:MAG: hypothetical protein WDN49_03990 [Acetobacteraceae bacterium]
MDRSADALRCANMVGTHKWGGCAGRLRRRPRRAFQHLSAPDRPDLRSRDDAGPPAGRCGEILSFGLAGLAMSRFAGLWVALKTISETAEQAATIIVPSERHFITPDIAIPPHGPEHRRAYPMARRTRRDRAPRPWTSACRAAAAWWRANGLDRVTQGSAEAPIGIVTVGKAHHDVRHALARLGLARSPSIAVYKVGMAWPLETAGLRAFAAGRRAFAGGGGEAQLRRGAGSRRAVQPAGEPAPRHRRQDGPGRRVAAAGHDGTVAGTGDGRPRPLPAGLRHRRRSAARRRQAGPSRRVAGARADLLRPAARTTPPPSSRTAASPWPASAATSWR